MIDIREIRIGNVVTKVTEQNGEKFYEPLVWDIQCYIAYWPEGSLQPIELTPLILEGAGIKDDYVKIQGFIMSGDYHRIATAREINLVPKYLHQLQNIWFDLTGEELPVGKH